MRKGGKVCVDKAVKISVHDSVDIAVFKACACVLCKGVGHEYIGTYLSTPCDLLLNALDVLDLVKVFSFLYLGKLGYQHLHGIILVLVLATLSLAGYNYSCGLMCKTYSGACFVDLLSACAAGTVEVDLQILGAYLDVKVSAVHFGHNFQGSK